jgi:hypothetical protein
MWENSLEEPTKPIMLENLLEELNDLKATDVTFDASKQLLQLFTGAYNQLSWLQFLTVKLTQCSSSPQLMDMSAEIIPQLSPHGLVIHEKGRGVFGTYDSFGIGFSSFFRKCDICKSYNLEEEKMYHIKCLCPCACTCNVSGAAVTINTAKGPDVELHYLGDCDAVSRLRPGFISASESLIAAAIGQIKYCSNLKGIRLIEMSLGGESSTDTTDLTAVALLKALTVQPKRKVIDSNSTTLSPITELFLEKCAIGSNHFQQLLTHLQSGKITLVKLELKRLRIYHCKDSSQSHITISKLWELVLEMIAKNKTLHHVQIGAIGIYEGTTSQSNTVDREKIGKTAHDFPYEKFIKLLELENTTLHSFRLPTEKLPKHSEGKAEALLNLNRFGLGVASPFMISGNPIGFKMAIVSAVPQMKTADFQILYWVLREYPHLWCQKCPPDEDSGKHTSGKGSDSL